MTTRDYENIADAIRPIHARHERDLESDEGDIEAIVEALCEVFTKDNPRFHKATFYRRALGHLPSEVMR